MKHYRQGDVLLTRITRMPAKTKRVERDRGRIVLSYGEVTGHAHSIDSEFAELVETESQRYLRATKVALLTHEEHAPIAILPGIYRVIQQREWDSAAIRPVQD